MEFNVKVLRQMSNSQVLRELDYCGYDDEDDDILDSLELCHGYHHPVSPLSESHISVYEILVVLPSFLNNLRSVQWR